MRCRDSELKATLSAASTWNVEDERERISHGHHDRVSTLRARNAGREEQQQKRSGEKKNAEHRPTEDRADRN